MEEISIINRKEENFLIKRLKKYQIITFTFGFLFLYRFAGTLFFYSQDKQGFLEEYRLSIWFFIIALPIIYFLQWVIITWIASKYTRETFKEKLYRHPIATIFLTLLYLADLPYRLAGSDWGSGVVKYINIFENVIYYLLIYFLWWLLVCWISKKLWEIKKFNGIGIKKPWINFSFSFRQSINLS